MRRVDCVRADATSPCSSDVFTYVSDRLEYDWDGDGVTTWRELDEAPTRGVIGVGNNNGVLDDAELPFVSSVGFSFDVQNGDASKTFYATAQLRNQR
jgi:hypothetical protein